MSEKMYRVIYIGMVYRETFLNHTLQFTDDFPRVFYVLFSAQKGEVRPPYTCLNIEIFFQVFNILFTGSEEVSRYIYFIEG